MFHSGGFSRHIGRTVLGLCLATLALTQVALAWPPQPSKAQTPLPLPVSGVERASAGDPVRLEVQTGWAHLRGGGDPGWITPLNGSQLISDGFYLELGTSTEVELSWPGSASIRLTGPAGVFVEPVSNPIGGRSIGFRRLASAEIEVRRGVLSINLPRGQRLTPSASLFRLEGHPGGYVDLFHRAGAPIELDVGARYSFPLAAGTRRRLPDCVAPLLPTPPGTRGRIVSRR